MPSHLVAAPAADPVATAALIQDAIDRAHAAGGGVVVLAGGQRFASGTIELRSHVQLHLEPGAVLLGSAQREHYREMAIGGEYGGSVGGFLIVAHDAEGIAITGPGAIDGDSLQWMDGWREGAGRYIRAAKAWRPRGIGFYHCTGVRLESFTIRDMAQWTIHLTGCADVLCSGLTIRNRLDVPNCDGIDPDRCRDVRIIGCHIQAGDDGVVLKNTRDHAGRWADRDFCGDITVHGCTIVSTSAGLKIGTESAGDFRRIVFSGCTIRGSHRGVAIQLRDHGTVEDVLISDCVIETRRFHELWWGNAEPIAITAVPRRADTVPGRIRRVRVRNVLCRGENGIVIHGNARSPIEDVAFDGVDVVIARSSRWEGGKLDLRPMNGAEHGGLSAADNPGVLVRHARDLRLRDVAVRFADEAGWYGHGLDAEDAPGLMTEGCRFAPGRPGMRDVRIA